MATDLLESLRAGGELESHGAFSIDRNKARDKLRQFQLADPRSYVLELVQVAVLRGATRVEVEADADDFHMRFDGKPFALVDFEHLYGALFSVDHGAELQARRALALGLNGAMALARLAVVRSGGHELRLQAGEEDALGTSPTPSDGTEIHVKQRFRAATVVEFFGDLRGTLAEEIYLRERCAYAPLDLVLEGQALRRPWHVPDALVELPLLEGGLVSLRESPDHELRLFKHGVWIATHRMEPRTDRVPPWHVIAHVEIGATIPLDVSLRDVVRGPAYLEMLERVERAAGRAWGELCRRLAPQHPPWLFAAARRVLANFESAEERRARVPELLRLPLWQEARGTSVWISTEQALASCPPGTKLGHTRDAFPSLAPEGPAVFLGAQEYLGVFANPGLSDATSDLRRALKRQQNMARWRERAMAPVLPEGHAVLARASLSTPRGEIALLPEGRGRLILVKDGAGLVERPLDWPLPVLLVIEADLQPNDTYDDALNDETLAAALLGAFRDGVDLATRAGVDAVRPAHRRRLLGMLLLSTVAERVLEGAGFSKNDAQRHADLLRARHPPVLEDFSARVAPGQPLAAWPVLFDSAGALLTFDGIRTAADRDECVYVTDSAADAATFEQLRQRPDAAALLAATLCLVMPYAEVNALERLIGARRRQRLAPDLQRIDGRLKHLARAEEPLQLTTPCLGTIEVFANNLHGMLGIEKAVYVDPTQSSTHRARVRVLAHHRLVDQITVDVPLGPLVAVVNDDDLPIPIEGKLDHFRHRVSEALKKPAAALFTTLCEEVLAGGHAHSPHVRSILFAAMTRALSDGVPREDYRRIRTLLFELPLFRSQTGLLSYNALPTSRLHVLAPTSRFVGRPSGDRVVLVLDELARQFLVQQRGETELVSAESWYERQEKIAGISARPEERAVLAPSDDTLVIVPFAGQGFKGEIGLDATPKARAAGDVRLLRQKRFVETLTMESPFPFRAVLDAAKLPLTAEPAFDPQPVWVHRLREAVLQAWPVLLDALLDAHTRAPVSGPRASWPPAARRRVLEFLAALETPGVVAIGSPQTSELVERCRQAPLFATFLGAPALSLAELAQTNADLDHLPFWPDTDDAAPPDDVRAALAQRTVIRLDPELTHLLGTLLARPLKPYAAQLTLDRVAAAQWRDRPAVVPKPARVLVDREQRSPELQVTLWLPTTYEPLQVQCASGDRLVGHLELSPFACAGIVTGSGLALGATLPWTPPDDLSPALEPLARRLYERLAAQWREERVGSVEAHEAATEYLGACVIALARAQSGGHVLKRDVARLFRLLRSLPLLPRPDGRRVSLVQARQERPEDLTHLGLWSSPSTLETEADADPPLVPDAAGEPAAQVIRAPAPELVSPQDPSPARLPASADPAPLLPAPLDPETRLLQALRVELRWVRAARPKASRAELDDLDLEHLAFRRGGEQIAHGKGTGLRVLREHPAVQHAVARGPEDLAALAFVASGIHSAINAASDAITDADERDFCQQLIRTLCQASLTRR